MNRAQILTASGVQQARLDDFLRRFKGQARADFLRSNGDWRHRSSENRWVLQEGDEIAGYCAVIPARVLVAGVPREAIWWVDLIIAPEHRGRGLQNLFDREILSRSSLKLGFPNALAAQIHRRHGWGVREDLRSLLLPLRPRKIRALRRGNAGALAATVLEPFSAAIRWRFRTSPGRQGDVIVERTDCPDLDYLAHIAEKLPPARATTMRSAEHLQWRYSESPHSTEHRFYIATRSRRDSIALVTRTLVDDLGCCVRILDIFGDLEDRAAIRSAVRRVLSDAIADRARQVLVLTSNPSLRAQFQMMGFLFGARTYFCWHTEDAATFQALAEPGHWVIADSDNDLPV